MINLDTPRLQPQYVRILHYENCQESDLSCYVAFCVEPGYSPAEIYGLDKYTVFPHYEDEFDDDGNPTGNRYLSYWDTLLGYWLSDLNRPVTVCGRQYWQVVIKGQLSGFQSSQHCISADLDVQLPFRSGKCEVATGRPSSIGSPAARLRLRGQTSVGVDNIRYMVHPDFCEERTISLPDVAQLSTHNRIVFSTNNKLSSNISVYLPKLNHISYGRMQFGTTVANRYSYQLYAPQLTSFAPGSIQNIRSLNSSIPGYAHVPAGARIYGDEISVRSVFKAAQLSSFDYPGLYIDRYFFGQLDPNANARDIPLFVSAENAISAGEGAFMEASRNGTSYGQFFLSLPSLQYAAASCFCLCKRLASLDLPELLSVSSDRTFAYDNELIMLRMPKAKILETEDETVYSRGYRMLEGVSSNISVDLSQSYGIGDFFPIAVTDTLFFDNWLGYDNSGGNRATFMLSDGVQYSDGWFDRAAEFRGLDTCITLTQVSKSNTAWRSWGANSAVDGFICGKAIAAGYYYGGDAGRVIAKAANWGSWYYHTTDTWQSCLTIGAERLSVQFANIKSLEKMSGTDPYDGHDWLNTDMSRVSRVELGSQITSIGDCAFLCCYNLTSFNDFITTGTINNVGPSAFMHCQLPFNGPRAFHCWPSIGQRAFACDCAISSFALDGYYDDVDVGQNAFEGCINLETVTHIKDAFFLDEAPNFPFGCKNDNTMATVFYQYFMESGSNFTYTPDTGSSSGLYNHLYIGRLIDLNPFKVTTVMAEVESASKAFTVYWGDGTSTSYQAGNNFNIQHTYQIVPDNQLSVTYGSKTYYTPAYRKRRVLCITNGDGLFMYTYSDGTPYFLDTSTGVGLQLQTISYGILPGSNPAGGCW